MKVKVKIKKLAGETGLLVPGTLVDMDENKAKKLAKLKIVIIQKERKQSTETKEHKTAGRRITKAKK